MTSSRESAESSAKRDRERSRPTLSTVHSTVVSRLHPPGLLLAAAALLSTGCVLVFNPPLGQHFEVAFELDRALEGGEKHVVATWTLADAVDTRKRTLQLSGGFERPAGARLPREVRLVATVTEPPAGKVRQRIKLNADVRPEDRFRVSKRIRRDVAAGSTVEVTVEPVGDDLVAGTRVKLCFDLVQAKRDLDDFPSCAAGAGPTTFAAIQNEVLTPSCAGSNCHDTSTRSAGLDLSEGQAYDALVDVPSSQIFLRRLVAPGKPDDSYLVQKIRGSSSINGGRMPLGGAPLSADQISGIVEWIENGAREN